MANDVIPNEAGHNSSAGPLYRYCLDPLSVALLFSYDLNVTLIWRIDRTNYVKSPSLKWPMCVLLSWHVWFFQENQIKTQMNELFEKTGAPLMFVTNSSLHFFNNHGHLITY